MAPYTAEAAPTPISAMPRMVLTSVMFCKSRVQHRGNEWEEARKEKVEDKREVP